MKKVLTEAEAWKESTESQTGSCFFFRLCRGLMDFMYCKIKEQELTSLFDSFLV